MPQLQKGVLWATVDGQKVALAQSYDKDGNPQLVSADTPMPVTGTMQLMGRKVAQTKTQADAVGGVVTFSKNIDYIAIYNTSGTDGVFNVNGLDLFIPANSPFADPIGGTPRATVNVTGATSYAMMRYE